MVFTPSFSVEISADGKTVTFINTSNFGTNTEGYQEADFTTNELILKDAYGVLIQTIPFPTSGADINKIVYQLTKDQWIDATLNLAGIASYTKLVRSGFYGIYQAKAKCILQRGCCGEIKHCDDFSKSQLFRDTAVFDALPIGNAIEFQENIDAANSFIKTSV